MNERIDNRTIINIVYNKHKLKRYVTFVIGILLVAISYNIFTMKCNIVYGMGGIGLIMHKLFSIDASLVILLGNIILIFLSLLCLGKENTKNTIFGSLLYPLFIKLTEPLCTIDLGNMENILIAICGSLVTGFGLGLVFKAGYTTGGTDILNQIVSKYGKMSVGKAMYFTDSVIILASIIAFDFPTIVYSILNLYIVGLITDKVVLGISGSKAFYIITEHETEVKKFIIQNLSHGVTILEARGGYTGNLEKVIMCIIPTKEYYLFKEGIKMIDQNAFFIVTDAYEVSGGV